MAQDYELYLHKEWLGLLQPEGLVVSPPALADAQAFVDKQKALELQPILQGLVEQDRLLGQEQTWVADFSTFAEKVLEWEEDDYIGQLPDDLAVELTNYGEVLRPDYGVEDPDSDGWLLLVQTVPLGHDLDKDDPGETGWKATYQQKFERLLKGVQVPIGILWNGVQLRLVYAPAGESSGHLTFHIEAMTEVPGRLILGALEMLVGAERLFNAPTAKTLPKLLEASRNYQANVSNKLAEQVLEALWELLRGFQAADVQRDDRRDDTEEENSTSELQQLAKDNPQHVYGGLLTTLMRLVFLLYAEDQGLMPDDAVYQGNYSVSGLYDKLREDAGRYPDTMDQRYGAWATLLSLFRLVYDGGGAYEEYLPARHGQLFDPDEYPFLEGRPQDSKFQSYGRVNAPRIADGVIYRMLEKLLILDGERLSYRALDVEQIGSVYEAIMGYEVEVAKGLSIAVKPKDVVINVEVLLATKSKDRSKWLKDTAECKITGKGLTALKKAETVEEIVAALDRRVSSRTQNLLVSGSLYLQPGEERRRTGSHYTPRKLTQPIVETTLRPIFEQLGEHPTAEQILALKVCDLAMGSAAFLVETCRQLAEKLVEAWDTHGMPEDVPEAVEPLLYARRLVAQRCLYGVDKNPFAVNLAKLSLWLVTLARDLPFTFVDHALKCGDSLVGISKKEINSFVNNAVYSPTFEDYQKRDQVDQPVAKVRQFRELIQASDALTDEDDAQKRKNQQAAEAACAGVRLAADLIVAAFLESTTQKDRKEKLEDFSTKLLLFEQEFSEENLASQRLSADLAIAAHMEGRTSRQRDERRREFAGKLIAFKEHQIPAYEVLEISERLRTGSKGILPFNWEIEFPEVFDRENPGFDAIVGNPPFLGGTLISGSYSKEYLGWIKNGFPETGNRTDLVAYFFRRAFELIRKEAALGLVATNTISQGDTRTGGLSWICKKGGTIFEAERRFRWPGLAAVIVSLVYVFKGSLSAPFRLNKREVTKITAFLFHAGSHEDPKPLLQNSDLVYEGVKPYGDGFLFEDGKEKATPVTEMHSLIQSDPENKEVIFPYIGGSEINSHPEQKPTRYIINFGDRSEDEARKWPDLIQIVEEKVKPERMTKAQDVANWPWWKFWRMRKELYEKISDHSRTIAISRVSQYLSLAFLPVNVVFTEGVVVFAFEKYRDFAFLQSRIHEIWAKFFGSSMKDDLRYTSSVCFDTLPFPENWEAAPTLEAVGKTYYEYRADLMVRNNQGLTDTYNRFHDPEERGPDLLKLRELHAQMDRAVLDAYGWTDIDTTCGFALDYLDIDEDKLPTEAKDRINRGDLYFTTATEAAAFDNLVQSSLKKRKKLPWRYRWPETTHDEVLARLLDLNQQRHEAEVLGAQQASQNQGRKAKAKRRQKAKSESETPMIPGMEV